MSLIKAFINLFIKKEEEKKIEYITYDPDTDWVLFGYIHSAGEYVEVEPTGLWKIVVRETYTALFLEVEKEEEKVWIHSDYLLIKAKDKVFINRCGCEG